MPCHSAIINLILMERHAPPGLDYEGHLGCHVNDGFQFAEIMVDGGDVCDVGVLQREVKEQNRR